MTLQETLKEYRIKADLNMILDIWNEPNRHWHNQNHLFDLLEQINTDFDHGLLSLTEKKKLQMVALFHDVIYDPSRSDNEEKSAEFMVSICEDRELLNDIYQAILDTKTHQSSSALSEKFNKYDMNIVERDYDSLLKWEEGIRKEYSMYSDEQYKEGRVKFLESLLDKYVHNSANLDKLIRSVERTKNISEGYIVGKEVEDEYKDISITSSNVISEREKKMIYTRFSQSQIKEVRNLSSKLNFLKDDGYYYMKYKNGDTPYISKDYYFRFDDFNQMLDYIDKIVQWKIEFSSGIGTGKEISEFIGKMQLENDPYFSDLAKGKERQYNRLYPYPTL
jgi:predicted metal-dependent HD superfamily phosphohydrolase